MTTLEQAQMFASYGLFVSVHGSKLANLIFAQPNALVIELTPTLWECISSNGNSK
jgi:capsular polysaccharide biosynthesis protein